MSLANSDDNPSVSETPRGTVTLGTHNYFNKVGCGLGFRVEEMQLTLTIRRSLTPTTFGYPCRYN